jgi:hypothetical protein
MSDRELLTITVVASVVLGLLLFGFTFALLEWLDYARLN